MDNNVRNHHRRHDIAGIFDREKFKRRATVEVQVGLVDCWRHQAVYERL
jgi:hypothetical protein